MKLYPFALILAFPALAAAQTLTGPLPAALQVPRPIMRKAVHPPVPPLPPPPHGLPSPAQIAAGLHPSTTTKAHR